MAYLDYLLGHCWCDVNTALVALMCHGCIAGCQVRCSLVTRLCTGPAQQRTQATRSVHMQVVLCGLSIQMHHLAVYLAECIITLTSGRFACWMYMAQPCPLPASILAPAATTPPVAGGLFLSFDWQPAPIKHHNGLNTVCAQQLYA
jgi:hypothetical protein